MNKDFAPMDNEEYIDGFVSALIDAYQDRDDLHRAEAAVLYLMELPSDRYVPLVWHGQTLMMTVDESPALHPAGFINDIYHGDPPITVPVVLPINEWRGKGSRPFSSSLNWFGGHISANIITGMSAPVANRSFTIACEAAVIVAGATSRMPEGMLGSLAGASHGELHKAHAFPGKGDHDSEDILSQVSRFLREVREN